MYPYHIVSQFCASFPFNYVSYHLWFSLSFLVADIIFLIYVYQRWIYPVDKKRVNEFGFGGEDDQVTDGADAATTTTVPEEEKKTN